MSIAAIELRRVRQSAAEPAEVHSNALQSSGFDRDAVSALANDDGFQHDVHEIITAIARASHDIADLVSLGRSGLPPIGSGAAIDGVEAVSALRAKDILVEHLSLGCVRSAMCADGTATEIINESGAYTVVVEPLEGKPDSDANLPFGTIFSIERVAHDDARAGVPVAAGFIHYGPQTNLVITMGDGVCIFNLDRVARIYRLAADKVTIPDSSRELAIDATRCGRWPSTIRALINQQLEEAERPGAPPVAMLWTGSLTADAYRILRRGGAYLCLNDEGAGCADRCPSFRYAARPIAFVVEQAGGLATTGYERLLDRDVTNSRARTSLIFGSRSLVERIERIHKAPETFSDTSPLFRNSGLFRL